MLSKLGQKLVYGSVVGIIAASALVSAACSSTTTATTAATAAASQTKASQAAKTAQSTPAKPSSTVSSSTQTAPGGQVAEQQSDGSQPNVERQGGVQRIGGMGNTGTLTALDGTTLTLESPQGTQVTVEYSSETTFLKTVSAAISDLLVDEQVRVSGSEETDGTITASSITTGSQISQGPGGMGGRGDMSDQPAPGDMPSGDMPTGEAPTGDVPARPADDAGFPGNAGDDSGRIMISGTISSVGADSIVVKIEDGTEVTVKATADTRIQQTVTASSADLQTGIYLMVQGDNDDSGKITATSISILPEGLTRPDQFPDQKTE